MNTMSDGYSIPIHRSLTEPILMAGAPRGLAILNGTIAAAVGLGLQMWVAGIVLFIVGHAVSVYAAKKDPKFLEAGVRHLKHKSYLSC
jgi:type IV secretion system protein TrbD